MALFNQLSDPSCPTVLRALARSSFAFHSAASEMKHTSSAWATRAAEVTSRLQRPCLRQGPR